MTREELAEKVALAMYVQEHGSADEYSFYRPPYILGAEVAIAVVLEEAANVVENTFLRGSAHTYSSENADLYIAQESICSYVARRIRALGKE